MLEKLIAFSIRHRWMMLLFTLALIAIGAWSFTKLPIDAQSARFMNALRRRSGV